MNNSLGKSKSSVGEIFVFKLKISAQKLSKVYENVIVIF